MEKHCENARTVADFLHDHPDVAWVSYPGLEDHETHDLASRYLEGGYGGMVTFGLDDGFEAAKTLCESVDLASFLANIGDAKTLIIHPASTTHAQLSAEEQRAAGVDPDMLRLSVGIEDADDVVADLEQGIERAVSAT
jgi:O-acetylhomoserine (thiol)-lyase